MRSMSSFVLFCASECMPFFISEKTAGRYAWFGTHRKWGSASTKKETSGRQGGETRLSKYRYAQSAIARFLCKVSCVTLSRQENRTDKEQLRKRYVTTRKSVILDVLGASLCSLILPAWLTYYSSSSINFPTHHLVLL